MAKKVESVGDVKARKPRADGTTANQPQPIGVPGDYLAPVEEELGVDQRGRPIQGPRRVTPVQPLYFEGDEVRFGGLALEVRVPLQRALHRAGLIPKDAKFQEGAWDPVTQEAMRSLLGYANQWGMSYQDALHEYARIRDTYGEQMEPAEPLVLRPSNPEDVRAQIRASARRLYGKGASPDLVERLTQEWMAAEEQQQRDVYATDQALTAGAMEATVQEMPSLETFAENRLRAADPERAASFETLNQADVFFGMVDGG